MKDSKGIILNPSKSAWKQNRKSINLDSDIEAFTYNKSNVSLQIGWKYSKF